MKKNIFKRKYLNIIDKKFASDTYLGQLEELYQWFKSNDDLKVQSSGTTGSPKTILLRRQHVVLSAILSIDFFDLKSDSKVLLNLPLNRIGGIMLAVRAFMVQAQLFPVDPARKFSEVFEAGHHFDFASMVPNQLAANLEYLDRIKTVLVGGGPIHQDLIAKLAELPTVVWHSYASTETISHVALRRIHPNLLPYYEALKGVHFSTNGDSELIIHAPTLGLEALATKDQVELVSDSSFKWLGRTDNVVLSGGLKLYPEEIETEIKLDIPFFLDQDEDPALGQRLVLITIDTNWSDDLNIALKQQLKGPKRPKAVYTVSSFEYTSNGKLQRSKTRAKAKFHSLI